MYFWIGHPRPNHFVWSIISEEEYSNETGGVNNQVDGQILTPNSLTSIESGGNDGAVNDEANERSDNSTIGEEFRVDFELAYALQPRQLFSPNNKHPIPTLPPRPDFSSRVELLEVQDLSEVLHPVKPIVPEAVVCDRVQDLSKLPPFDIKDGESSGSE